MRFLLTIKKNLRDIKEIFGPFLAISIIIAIGAAFFVGLNYTYQSIDASINNYYKDSKLASYWLNYNEVTSQEKNRIEDLKYVDIVEPRIVTSGFGKKETDFTVYSYVNRHELNQLTFTKGAYPKEQDELLIDSAYATENKLKVDDYFTLTINNKKMRFKISGIFESPEFIYYTKDASQPVPNHKKFGIAFIREGTLKNDFLLEYNQLIIKTKLPLTKKNREKMIDNIESGMIQTSLKSVTSRSKHPSLSFLNERLELIKTMSTLFPLIFVILASIITFISMGRQIETQRSQIGVIRSFGASNLLTISNFLYFPILTSLLGTILGTIIGMLVFPKVLLSTFDILFVFPTIKFEGFLSYTFIVFLVSLILSVLSTIIASKRIMKEIPAQALRPLPPKNAKKSIFEQSKLLWNNLSYPQKLIVRNITLNKRRFFFSSLGIIFCTSIMIAALGLRAALSTVINDEFQNIRNYDINARLETPSLTTPILANEKIENIDIMSSLNTQFRENDYEISVGNLETSSIRLYNSNNQRISLNNTGIYMSKKLAETHDIQKGDYINLPLELNNSSQTVKIKVADVYTSYTNQGFYATFDLLKKLGYELPIENILVTANKESDIKKITKDLKKMPEYTAIVKKQKQLDDYVDASQSTNLIFLILVIASGLLLFTVLYNISSVNIFERQRDIATEKVIGLTNKEINKLIFTENVILVTFSFIISLIFSENIYELMSGVLEQDNMMFPATLNATSIPLALFLLAIFTIMTNQFLKRKVKSVDMVEALKSVE